MNRLHLVCRFGDTLAMYDANIEWTSFPVKTNNQESHSIQTYPRLSSYFFHNASVVAAYDSGSQRAGTGSELPYGSTKSCCKTILSSIQ